MRYVLEGSVRKAGSRVRITGQLIDAVTGTHLWADRFDGSLEDVFDLQDKVAVSPRLARKGDRARSRVWPGYRFGGPLSPTSRLHRGR